MNRWWISGVAALAVLVALELWVRAVTEAPAEEVVQRHRAANVVSLGRAPATLPLPRPGPKLLLMGNSHTYALPGLERGQSLRADPGDTLIDRLAVELSASVKGADQATFYRASNPNLLPFEMLVRWAWLRQHGFKPDVVVLGITWRNVARDSALRAEFRNLLASPELASELSRIASENDELREAVSAAVREEEQSARSEGDRSWADRADETLQKRLGERVALIGRSADVRARLYRRFAYAVDTVVLGDKAATHAYEMIERDLAFNRACLFTLVKLLRGEGVRVVVYLAPQRDDLPPLMDPGPEEAFNADLASVLKAEGAVLVDARRAVPNEFWGWEEDAPDRSHFREPGHAALARRLAQAAEAQTEWGVLGAP